MKRTTLILEDGFMDAVREIAHREKRKLSEVVNELLAEGLARRARREIDSFELPVFSMGRPRVNLADRDALEQAMER
jgi:predicted DNA-binding ribbon-helix-helix protein